MPSFILIALNCMAEFLCHTATLCRNEWSQGTRERFTAFVKERRLDNYEYSRLMVSDELLEAFLKQDQIKRV